MISIDFLTTVFFSGLCLLLLIGVFVGMAILGTRAKLRSANRMLEAQARGAFDDLEAPENKSRFRRLAVMALMGMLGMIVSLIILVLQLTGKLAGLYGITIAAAVIFGATSSIAGLLMNREIDRRL